ncbi:MAG: hypothetical protein AB7K09_07990 [Planctomycetota bacterium]
MTDPLPSTADELHRLLDAEVVQPPLHAALAGLRALPEGADGAAVDAALRTLAEALHNEDEMTRQRARQDALSALRRARVSGPAAWVNAMLDTLPRAGVHSPLRLLTDADERAHMLADYDAETERLLQETPPALLREAVAALSDPRLVDFILRDIAAVGVAGEQDLAMALYLCGTSRMLSRPLGVIVQGPSSSGKSYTRDRVASLLPPEALLVATDITAQALYYLPAGRLIHRYVVAGERSRMEDDDRAEATRALREMLSAGELRKAAAGKASDRPTTTVHYQPGPIAYSETTTLTRIFAEDANRCLLFCTDDSPEQTRRVIGETARRAMGGGSHVAPVIARHHAMQRLLRRVTVTVPYAEAIGARVPDTRPEARRAYSHLVEMIRAVALLHQRQRVGGTVEHGDTIAATEADYVVARRLLVRPLGRALGRDLSDALVAFARRLWQRFGERVFTTTEAGGDAVIRHRKGIIRGLNELADAGFVQMVEPHAGARPASWCANSEPTMASATWLPTVAELREGIAS